MHCSAAAQKQTDHRVPATSSDLSIVPMNTIVFFEHGEIRTSVHGRSFVIGNDQPVPRMVQIKAMSLLSPSRPARETAIRKVSVKSDAPAVLDRPWVACAPTDEIAIGPHGRGFVYVEFDPVDIALDPKGASAFELRIRVDSTTVRLRDPLSMARETREAGDVW